MDVITMDLPRLMREGFHWTEGNVDRSRGYFSSDIPPWERSNYGAVSSRVFCILYHPGAFEEEGKDDQNTDLDWVVKLVVYGQAGADLPSFRLSHLSPDNIYCADAFTIVKRLVYKYDAPYPESSLNAIYDDMPMEGWWPWPKGKAMME